MFRFTIRDVLWLTVVVGIAVAWLAQAVKFNDMKREVEALKNDLENSEWQVEQSDEANDALISELEKLTGKRYRGMTHWKDPTGYPKQGYTIIYDENQETSQAATETP